MDGEEGPLTGRARGRWVYKWRQKKRGRDISSTVEPWKEKPCVISFSFSVLLIYFVKSALNRFVLLSSGFTRSSISCLQLRRKSYHKKNMSSK